MKDKKIWIHKRFWIAGLLLLLLLYGLFIFLGNRNEVKAANGIGENAPSVNLYAVWSSCTHSWKITSTFLGADCTRQCTVCGKQQVVTWIAVNEACTEYTFEPAYEGYQEDSIAGLSWFENPSDGTTYAGAWHDVGTEVTLSATMKEGYRFACIHNGNDIHTNINSYTWIKKEAASLYVEEWTELWQNELELYSGRTKSCVLCGDETLYALWLGTDGDDTIKITANNPNYAGFGTNEDMTLYIYEYPNDEEVSFTASGESGYKYYWTAEEVDYPDSDTVSFTVTGVRGLTAKKEKCNFTVSYSSNGGRFSDGTTADKSKEVAYGDNVPLELVCEKAGYNFVGWALKSNATVTLPHLQMPSEDITLYAMYSLPFSDVERAELVVWSETDSKTTIRYSMVLSEETINAYTFSVEGLDITQGLEFSSVNEIYWKIVIFDQAGNFRELIPENAPEPPPEPVYHVQMTEHYKWIADTEKGDGSGEWKYITSTQKSVKEGEIYTPAYLTEENEKYGELTGYDSYSIDEAYIVTVETGAKTTYAYYMPCEYQLIFDANGGTCTTTSKTVYHAHAYGQLPLAKRQGYDFLGWFTAPEGGTEITAQTIHGMPEDCRIYAHWGIHRHKLTYDYWTHGGNGAETPFHTLAYGTSVDLTVEAFKVDAYGDIWKHVGWNTIPGETTVMTETSTWTCQVCQELHQISEMPDHDVTLYAVYAKEVIATFIDGMPAKQHSEIRTLYNLDFAVPIVLPTLTEIEGWNPVGWTIVKDAGVSAEYGAGTEYRLDVETVFYALYEREVCLSYDTNGSAQTYPIQQGMRYYNASGEYQNPLFVAADAPVLDKHTFVEWGISGGPARTKNDVRITNCVSGDILLLENDATLKVLWDVHPEIEAYDRYFTLEQAQNGEITETELLRKVKVYDKEDGILVNGVSVVVNNYDASVFEKLTEDTKLEITYQAEDSFGNRVYKTSKIVITDTNLRESSKKYYVRFISKRFFQNEEGILISQKEGGLEDCSIWRTNEEFRVLLQRILSNSKINVEKKIISAFGLNWEYKEDSSGDWVYKEETWLFTKEKIQQIKNYANDSNNFFYAMDKFYELFEDCRQ